MSQTVLRLCTQVRLLNRTVDEIFYNPQHPYTWGLLSSMPTLDTAGTLYAIPGTPPDLLEPPKGDAFAPRSEYAMQVDTMYDPPFFKVSETHQAATWLLHPDAPKVTPPIGIQNRQANFASIHLEPSEELAEMDTMDKEKTAKPKTDEPEIDPKLTEKGGLM